MEVLISTGRILFVILFVVSGVMKLTDVSGTAELIAQKLVIPSSLSQYAIQIEATTTIAVKTWLAVLAGLVEVVSAVMIAFGLARRSFGALLLVYVLVVTLIMHDFWNAEGADRIVQMMAALKNVSLIGGLLMIIGFDPGEPEEDRRIASYDGH